MRLSPFSFAVALAAFATIALELTLTRIFSVTMYYHFAFMVVALALMGLAVAGVVIYLLPRLLRPDRAPLWAAGFMLLFAVTTVLALRVTLGNPISVSNWQKSSASLLRIYFAVGAPFLCSGFALSLAISSAGARIGRIYAFDLVGAAIGCLLVIPAVSGLGGPGAVLVIAAAAGALSALLFAWSSARRSRLTTAGMAAAAVLAITLVWLGGGEGTARRFGRAGNPEKFLGNREVLFEKWNAFSQITVAPAGLPDHRWIFIDADAATRMWSTDVVKNNPAAPRRVGEIRVAALVYAIRHDGTALIIGPGGGTDVLSALSHGVPQVQGVEVNPIIVRDVMRREFAGWNGDLYRDPRVRVTVDEGRSFIRRATQPFASIQATLVDTWAASSSGAFTLSENTLYTVEAFTEFLAHLRADGVVTMTRWYEPGSPKEFLRLLAIARRALELRGVPGADVHKHFFIATDNEKRCTLLLGRTAFSAADLRTLSDTTAAGSLRVLFAPDAAAPGDAFLDGFLRAADPAPLLAGLPYDARPTTDNRPFFFYSLRPGQLIGLLSGMGSLETHNVGVAMLIMLFAISLALTVALVALPLLIFKRTALRESTAPKLRLLGFFATLGLGFILVEIGFMQKFVLFLGHPIYALGVVLATLLLSSGIGSALSGRLSDRLGARGAIRRLVAWLAGVLIVYSVALAPTFHALLGLPLPARVLIAAALVAVPGVLMGGLLPNGVRTAERLGAGMVPWAWGLNGITSVMGSILAVLLSMNVGFQIALLTGTAIYALGAWVIPAVADPGASSPPASSPS